MVVQVSSDQTAVDVNLHVIPLIDLMTCITAILIVTAVWTKFAQINSKPKGLGREATKLQEENKVFASILVSENEIWVGHTADVPIRIGKVGDKQDWVGLRKVLDGFRADP